MVRRPSGRRGLKGPTLRYNSASIRVRVIDSKFAECRDSVTRWLKPFSTNCGRNPAGHRDFIHFAPSELQQRPRRWEFMLNTNLKIRVPRCSDAIARPFSSPRKSAAPRVRRRAKKQAASTAPWPSEKGAKVVGPRADRLVGKLQPAFLSSCRWHRCPDGGGGMERTRQFMLNV